MMWHMPCASEWLWATVCHFQRNAGRGPAVESWPPSTCPALPACALALPCRACGMTDLYAWQAECLNLPGVIEHGTNLVYQGEAPSLAFLSTATYAHATFGLPRKPEFVCRAAPTSSGKSIVAWTLMLRALARDKKRKALLVRKQLLRLRDECVAPQHHMSLASCRSCR